LVLALFALISGAATAVSPCVLPVLPVVLGGSLGGGRWRPVGVVLGLVGAFVLFTLALTSALDAVGLSPTIQRDAAALVLLAVGATLLLPRADARVARALGPLSRVGDRLPRRGEGILGGLGVGVALGLVWTPCAGPILAAVTAAVAAGDTRGATVVVLLAYAVGAAVPLLLLGLGGRGLSRRLGPRAERMRQGMGVLVVAAGVLILLGLDTRFTAWALRDAPGYTNSLQAFERSGAVRSRLADVGGRDPGADGLARAAEDPAVTLPDAGPAPPLQGIGAWFNTPGDRPVSLASLRGRVVLLDFWTYSCVNCLRTLPHLEALNRAYRARGLTVIGVHTPEFAFEADPGNVGRAVRDLGVRYPVALDAGYHTWRAYGNEYWPAEYLIDRRGHVRDLKVGEGDYGHTETLVRRLLGLSPGAGGVETGIPDTGPGAELLTPESYLGYSRLARFAEPEQLQEDRPTAYRSPAAIGRDDIAYDGVVTVHAEDVDAGPGAAISLHFHARRVFLVLGTDGEPRTGRVLLDGRPLTRAQAGADVGPGGRLRVGASRLYSLVDLPRVGDGLLRVELAPGTRAYSFTFG
jgi:cytochrome c biogenesis protein CcdA/thiol-disulfide isomerase/thioredoxin